MKHRGIDFDVEEYPPSWWHWKIYPRTEGDQPVIGNMKFQTREAAVERRHEKVGRVQTHES